MMNLSEINQFLPWFVIILFQVTIFLLASIIKSLIKVTEANTVAKAQVDQAPAPKVIPPAVIVPPAPKPPPVIVPPAPKPEPTPLVVDEGLVDFIKKQEGFEPKAKWDYKQWTNGYGTKAAHADETITEAEAETRLRTEIAAADAFVTKRFPNLPKGLHQALIDLTFNAGPGWETQSLGNAVAAQKIDTIKADLAQYVHAGKPPTVLEDLVKRRAAEIAMIDHPV